MTTEENKKEKKANIYIDRVVIRIILSCGLNCQCPHCTVSFSQFVYSENPPTFLGKSPDMMWALWGQLRFRPDFTPACICFQRPQLPPSPQPPANLGDLICCSCSYVSKFPSFLVTKPLVLSFGFGPSSVCFLASVSHPDKRSWMQQLTRAHLLSWPRERVGYSRQIWDVQVVTTMVEACRKLLQPEEGCVISQGNWPWVVGQHRLQEGVGSYLCLLTAWWMIQWLLCQPLGSEITVAVCPTSGTCSGRDGSWHANLWDHRLQLWLVPRMALMKVVPCHLQAHGIRGSVWQWSLASLTVWGFSLDFLNCLILTPSDCLHLAVNPSPLPGDWSLKPEPQHPAPHSAW